MGLIIHFECDDCGYQSKILNIGMGFNRYSQDHPYIPCVCDTCKDFRLHQVDEITWGKSDSHNPKRAWANKIGTPICNVCNREMAVFDMFRIWLFITPHEILDIEKDIDYYWKHLNEYTKSIGDCIQCDGNDLKFIHDGFWD